MSSSATNDIQPSKESIKRLASDVREIMKNPLDNQGIFYKHSNSDMLSGNALIIGPPGTPYAYGFYFFKFKFPANYPHQPPTVTYLTNDGKTRFNPNYYRSGKVCLSILNTWKGPQWSGCNTISTVLLTLCTVLNEEPFLNEPGITKNHINYENYNISLIYSNLSVAILGVLKNEKINNIKSIKKRFSKEVLEVFKKNYQNIIDNIETYEKKYTNDTYRVPFYRMTTIVNFSALKKDFIDLNNELM